MNEHIENFTYDYHVDDNGNRQGEFTSYRSNGKQAVHCFYKDGHFHGEWKEWYDDGSLRHRIYLHGKAIMENPVLTDEYKFELCLTHGHMDFIPNT